MATPSKKRNVIRLEVKKKIIEASAKKTRDELSKEFGYPVATIKCILGRDRKAILEAIDEGTEAKRACLKPVKHEDLEEAVLRWFKAVRSENVEVSGPLLAVRFVCVFLLSFAYFRKKLRNWRRNWQSP